MAEAGINKDEALIEVQNIHAGYGKRKVLREVSVKIYPNSITLLMGPNGSGKSTLLKVIVGMLPPIEGRIFYKHHDITTLSPEERVNSGIGYLKQTRNTFTSLTVKENLELAGYGLDRQKIREGIEKTLYYFPFLKDKLYIRAGLISGGERQALAIGMVLMRKKEVLLLDEPTAGLSPSAANEILIAIKDIKEKEKTTVLLVEHNLNLVADCVDKIIAMREGKILLEEERHFLKDRESVEKLFLGS